MEIKYDKNSKLNCQNKLILIISDNFNRKLCNKTWPGQGVCVWGGGGGGGV